MAVQQIGLDYSWLVNLAQMLAQERERTKQPQISAVPGSVQTGAGAGPGPPLFATMERQEWKEEEAAKAALAEAEAGRAHEISLKEMDVESALAQAMAQERTSKYTADVGLKGIEAGGVTDIAIAQKTSKEKGKELVEMLWAMDKPSRDEIIALLEKKRDENQAMRGGTLTSGGRTVTTPGSTVLDPDDPLTILEDAGVYNPDTGLADPQPKGTVPTTQKLASDLTKQIDGMFEGLNMRIMLGIVEDENWDLLESIVEDVGAAGQYPEDIIEGEVKRRKAIYEESVKRNKPTDTEERNILGEVIHQIRHPEEGTEVTEEMSEMYKGGAGAYTAEEPIPTSNMLTTIRDFINTAFGGGLTSRGKLSKKTGLPVEEPTHMEVGEISEQDVVTEMGTWSKEKVKEFQTLAKAEGMYKGPISGLHSGALEDAAKEYFKKHKDEWGEEK